MKRKLGQGSGDDAVRALALQAHQISGILDPSVPIRALLEPVEAKPVRRRSDMPLMKIVKLSDPDLARHVNERLAPGGLN